MRRDQIFKLCANHRITPDIKMELFNEKQLRWMANDCSDGHVLSEYLTAKFRHEDEAKQFKSEFEKAQLVIKENQGKANNNSGVKQESSIKSTNNFNSLANAFKKEDGAWKCEGCLTSNKPEAAKCACCDQARVDKNFSYNENGKPSLEKLFLYQLKNERRY